MAPRNDLPVDCRGSTAIELREMNNEREWFRQVAKGAEGYTLPQPTRWHGVRNCPAGCPGPGRRPSRPSRAIVELHLKRSEPRTTLSQDK